VKLIDAPDPPEINPNDLVLKDANVPRIGIIL
jgi:hypothetical protein